jgi:hypothetical protein
VETERARDWPLRLMYLEMMMMEREMMMMMMMMIVMRGIVRIVAVPSGETCHDSI